jgi:hypothetical protein
MKPLTPTLILVIGLALMANGCSSLKPPAGDKSAWEQQQREDREATEKSFTPKDHPVFYSAVLAGLIAACVTGHGPVSSPGEFPAANSLACQSCPFFHFFTKIIFCMVKFLTDGAAHRPFPKTLLRLKFSKNPYRPLFALSSNRSAILFTNFYRLKPFHHQVRPPEMTKDYRILNFQPVIHPKSYLFFTFSIPKFNSGTGGLVKPVVFRSFSGLAEGLDGRCSAPSPSEP